MEENPLQCTICKNEFEEPILLSCQHTTCRKCSTGSPSCKSCSPIPSTSRSHTPHPDKLAAFLLDASKEEMEECANCEQISLPMFYCETCQQSLCLVCRNVTHQARMFSSHKIISSDERSKVYSSSLCKDHNEPYILYCSDVRKLVCIQCFNGRPLEERHSFISIEQGHRLCLERIEQSAAKLRFYQSERQEELNVRQRVLDENASNFDDARASLYQLCQQIIDTVMTTRETLAKELVKQQEQSDEQCKRQIKEIEAVMVVSRSGRPLSEKIHFIHFYFATMTIIKLERRDVRLLLLYEFRLGHSAMEAERNICGAMGEGALSYNTAKSWFQKFKNGDFSLEEIERSGRPVELNEEDLVKLVEEEPRLSLREMEEKLECCHSTIARHLGRLGFTSKLGTWVPHELSASQKLTRVNVCTQLLTFRRKFDWLNNLVTGDEKWVLYVNHSRKRQWLPIGEKGIPTPKPDLHPKKIMICVWWGVQGPVHWELLPTNKTITADYYCAQLDRVAEKTNGKYEKLYFLHDNARPHVAKKTFQKLQDLGWTVLPHPPYSPDLAPTDYHLFLSLSDYMRDKQFDDEEHLKTELSTFFSSRSPDFFSRGIMMLPSKWQQVVDTNGEYLCE